MTSLAQIFIVMGVACVGSLLMTPVFIKLAHKYGFLDDAKKHKHPAHIHKKPVPRGGGIPIFLSILIASLLFLNINQILAGVLLGAGLIVLLGFLDDLFDLPPSFRLIASFFIIAGVILFGLGVPFISNPFGGVINLDSFKWTYTLFGEQKEFWVLSNLFSLIWIVAIMNFVSWSSGVDGQLSGFAGISSLFLGVLALRFTAHDISSETVALFAFIVGASFLGFLPWHFYPQKIMPGYSGGALAGFLLGVLSILSWGKIGTLMLVLSVPLVDATYIIIRRLREGKSPLKGDYGHFHHRLLQIGWGRRRIAVFYWTVSLVFGVAAIYLQQLQKILALTIVFVLLGMFILVTNRVKTHI